MTEGGRGMQGEGWEGGGGDDGLAMHWYVFHMALVYSN